MTKDLKEIRNIRLISKQNTTNTLPNLKYTPLVHKSYEDRLRNYIQVRKRIFNQDDTKTSEPIEGKFQKARKRYNMRKSVKQLVNKSVEAVDNGDPRVFAEIILKNRIIKGLLDTGASVSLLGRGCYELLEEIGV